MNQLRTAFERLRHLYGRPAPPPADPFALAIWESCAYLVSDERRARVFERIAREVGLSPRAIRSTPLPRLARLIHDGGMRPLARAEKLHAAADVALEVGVARLRRVVREAPREARAILRRFPGIGEPGVDKILLFCHGARSLAPDSNALRVLIRLGFGRDDPNYTRQYRSAAAMVAAEIPTGYAALIAMHQLLRRHGQEVCRRAAPLCDRCPLTDGCRWYLDRLPGRRPGDSRDRSRSDSARRSARRDRGLR